MDSIIIIIIIIINDDKINVELREMRPWFNTD